MQKYGIPKFWSQWHFKDGASFCYSAYFLRISGWSEKVGKNKNKIKKKIM